MNLEKWDKQFGRGWMGEEGTDYITFRRIAKCKVWTWLVTVCRAKDSFYWRAWRGVGGGREIILYTDSAYLL